MSFELISEFQPTGDQPEAIAQLVQGINEGVPAQTLLGVTGSGKTFTVANVIARTGKPTLILSHNKTLAAQLYGEFKHFFPNDRVEYFVSYYDYYQPEAYLPTTNTYIEKDLSINDEIEKLRLSATSALLSGRRNVIVVASVSCIYGIGNPAEFHKTLVKVAQGQKIPRNKLLHELVTALYSRKDAEPGRGNFRVRGDVVEVYLAYADEGVRVHFWGDEIERIERFDTLSSRVMETPSEITIYPANIFVTSRETLNGAIHDIQDDMVKQVAFFNEIGKHLEAKRLEERVNYDLEMMRELGYCSGIENYSRYFDRRQTGQRPFCLLDYFPDDFLMVIDESHVTVSQVQAMYGGSKGEKAFEDALDGWSGMGKSTGKAGSVYLANYLSFEEWTDDRIRTLLLYSKGAAVIHAIRERLQKELGSVEAGDRGFIAFLRAILKSFPDSWAYTQFYPQILQQITKTDWNPFFAQYVYGTETPEVTLPGKGGKGK